MSAYAPITTRTLRLRPIPAGFRARNPVSLRMRGARGYAGRAEQLYQKATFCYTPPEPSPDKLAVLSLFSGIGGIDLGLESTGHFYTVGFCEIADYPRKVLRKHWGAEIPIFEDIHDVTAETIHRRGIQRIDVIAGGFPCQDISTAGKRAGIKAGTRSGLWLEFARIIGEIRPRYVLLENVAAITYRDGTRVITDLAQMGYDAQWATLLAADTGAPHARERWFCIGYRKLEYANSYGLEECESTAIKNKAGRSPRGYAEVDNSEFSGYFRDSFAMESPSIEARKQEFWRESERKDGNSRKSREGSSQSRLGRVFDGLPAKLDGSWVARPNEPQHAWEPPRTIATTGKGRNHRIKALGNAVVPQVVVFVGECLWRFHEQRPTPAQPSGGEGTNERERAEEGSEWTAKSNG
jgi:DNA (cytosine-5)-methyltransferase 1